jgi:hypothetical protein
MRSFIKFFFKPLFISLLLFGLINRASAEKAFKLKFQDWNEDDDRIRVRSWYAQANTPLSSNWDISVTGMVDTISGATPWGTPPTQNRNDWLVTLNERREAGIISLSSSIEDYDFSFELGRSKESDYLSESYAVIASKSFAEKTLTLNSGISYLDDDVDSDVPGGPGQGILSRKTPEIFLGIHRIIDPKTTLSLNLTYGRPKGYLSDPYKQIGRYEPLFIGSLEEDLFLYSENRPNKRDTFVAYLEGLRYFEKLDATLESSYRYFTDDSDLSGHTLEFQWLQRLSDRLILRPLLRYYIQNPADFYMLTLDGTDIQPTPQPNGTGPHYSSDYRLSKLKATTLGLKLTYFAKDNLSFDLSLDRYEMKGMDNQTDQRVYPSANVITVGTQWLF